MEASPWWRSRNAMRAWAGLGALAMLASGYFGGSWLIGRTRPPAVAAAEPPSTAPSRTPDLSVPIVVHGTGDVNLDPRQLGIVRAGFDEPWRDVRDLFRSDDLTVINLECSPGSGGVEQDKEFTFRCPGGFDALLDNGVDVTNLGNNHSMDYGKQAMLSGRDALIDAGLAPVGAGRDAAQANEPAIFERNGKAIAVLGFGGVIPTRSWLAGPDSPGMANGDDIPSMAAAVEAAAARADYVVVTLHWGAELETKPQGSDVDRARAMIDAGADAIFGHHAHRMQPLDFYKDRPIFYGLGNFVWPIPGPTAVAEVVFEPDGSVEACLLPATISWGRPTLTGAKSCAELAG